MDARHMKTIQKKKSAELKKKGYILYSLRADDK